MSLVSWRTILCTVLLLCVALQVLTVNGKERRPHVEMSVEDIDAHLFSPRDDPFAEEDKWETLTDGQKESWTSSNEEIDLSGGMGKVLGITQTLREKGISVPVDVQVVAADMFLSKDQTDRLSLYAGAMRAGGNGTNIKFRVKVAPQALYKRIAMHSLSHDPSNYGGVLEQAAATLGALNVLFVIVNHQDEPVNEFVSTTPFVGNTRVSWVLHNVEKGHTLNIAGLLTAAERAAERVFVPSPLYFPIPVIHDLQVDLVAFTPGHDHRALWLQNFAWDEFESSVRSVAVHGQKVRFFSSQVNAECERCEQAFRDVDKYNRDFAKKASSVLNNDLSLNETWSAGMEAGRARKRIAKDSFRLYVVDTVKLRKSENVARLQRRPLNVFPGMGIITFRSSVQREVADLESLLVKATIAGTYGVADPGLYMNPQLSRQLSPRTKRPSTILFDIIVRNLVRSVTERRLSELEEIVDGIVYFDIDPAKSLGDREYAYFSQRVNLMLAKIAKAQDVLSDLYDGPTALYVASSTYHDIKAIRSTFELDTGVKSFERFRDPTLRCHFSRLKREALRASQILETSYPIAPTVLLSVASFTLSGITTSFVLRSYATRKYRGKSE